jgi:hypothetical protein
MAVCFFFFFSFLCYFLKFTKGSKEKSQVDNIFLMIWNSFKEGSLLLSGKLRIHDFARNNRVSVE